MRAVFITSITGWVAFILIGWEIISPYLLRRNRISEWLGTVKFSAGKSYLKRMWPHYWLGYLLVVLSVIHTVVPMKAAGGLAGMNATGLWLATVGLLFLLVQSIIGWQLQEPKLTGRGLIRSWHYWLMFGVVVLVGVHVWLNG
ncbi:MAG TPA: hypothetical protein VH724_16775 [Candidatus Angelobacter sp.]|nr:hypothetical protein [Candidatus Angelobacter sp.]